MLEYKSIVFSFVLCLLKKSAKTIASPGLRDGKIATALEKIVPRKEVETTSLKHTNSWTGLLSSSPSPSLENSKHNILGKANSPKIQGINGALKKKLYFRVNTPNAPENTMIERVRALAFQPRSINTKETRTMTKTRKSNM